MMAHREICCVDDGGSKWLRIVWNGWLWH